MSSAIVNALSSGVAAMAVRAPPSGGARVARATPEAANAAGGGALGFMKGSALTGVHVGIAPRVVTARPSKYRYGDGDQSTITQARGRGRRGGGRRGGGGRGRGRRGFRVNMDTGPPRNEDIDLPEVRVIDEDKAPVGVMSSAEAQEIADEAGLDLVMFSPEANPPVCRIMNYSKYKYEQEKKQRETRKRAAATRIEVKELKMRYNIDSHDYMVRLKAAKKFLDGGDRVKLVCQFRGRENEFRDMGRDMFMKFVDDCNSDEDLCTLEGNPSMEGNRMVMVLGPVKEKQVKQQESNAREEKRARKAAAMAAAASADDDDFEEEEEEDEEEGSYDEEDGEEEVEEEEVIVFTKKVQ
jgi:translation initiation factor IF-3